MMKMIEAIAGLFVGNRKTASMGRVGFWLVFALCVYYWLSKPVEAFPQSLEYTLYFLMAYNFGGKAVNNFSRRGRPEPMGRAYDPDHED